MITPSSLNLNNQKEVEKNFAPLKLSLSEYSFPNLYLFRNKHQYEVVPFPSPNHSDLFYIKGQSYDNKSFIMPCFDPTALSLSDKEFMLQQLHTVDFLYPIAEPWLYLFPESQYKIEMLPADSDYLYTRDKLQNYPGKKLHSKRNLYKQFAENHQIEVLPLENADARTQALSILEQWQTDAGLSPDQADFLPCSEALELYDNLHLLGFLFLADGRPAGFTLGEIINTRHFALHFAKALRNFKGVYQYIFSETAAQLPEIIEYINLEQDLDDPGLRATKQSYQPDFMLHKFRVSYKN